MAKILGMDCPHCGARAQIKASSKVSDTLRMAYMYCTNLSCGHSWVAHIEAVRTISPPSLLCANPNVNLPISQRAEQERIWAIINQDENQVSIFDNLDEDKNEI